nr:hypothetical protein [Nocardia brevicatena]
MGLPAGGQFWLFAPQFALGFGNGHTFAGAHTQQVDLELGDGGQDVEKHLAHGFGGVVEVPAQRRPDAAGSGR